MSQNNEDSSRVTKGKIVVDQFCTKGELPEMKDIMDIGLDQDDLDRVYICDRNDNYTMFHFKANYNERKVSANGRDCIEASWGDQTVELEELQEEMRSRVSKVRGVVINQVTKEIVCRSFGETNMVFKNPSELEHYKDDGYIFKQFVEGATIRLFWDKDAERWLHSSHKKIDCTNSKVPGVEIGFKDMFEEASPNFNYDQLDKNKIYIIQVVHKLNQIMNQEVVETPTSYHLASIIRDGNLELIDEPQNNESKIDGFKYLDILDIKKAVALLQVRKCVIARKGYDIVQVVPKKLAKLVEIRKYTDAPYVPVELMYLRLKANDRPLLIQAVPPHQKQKASVKHMEKYIGTKSEELALFCANTFINGLQGRHYMMKKTLSWLVNQVRFKEKNIHHQLIKIEYLAIINDMVADNGETLYRCFKDMEAAKKSFKKNGFKNNRSTPNRHIKKNGITKNGSNKIISYRNAVTGDKNTKRSPKNRATDDKKNNVETKQPNAVLNFLSAFE